MTSVLSSGPMPKTEAGGGGACTLSLKTTCEERLDSDSVADSSSDSLGLHLGLPDNNRHVPLFHIVVRIRRFRFESLNKYSLKVQ